MGSYDITFCTNKKCKRTGCVRHHTHFERLGKMGITYLCFSEFNEKNCDHYWKDRGYWKTVTP